MPELKKSIYVVTITITNKMYRSALLCLAILISTSLGSCEELAYAFNESGCYELDQHTISEYNGSEIVTFIVPGAKGQSYELKRSIDSITNDIGDRLEFANPILRDVVVRLAAKSPGEDEIAQVCSIYDNLKYSWNYISDPRGDYYLQYANQTLRYGDVMGSIGAGDSDDFAILISALIENIGGMTRIILAYDEVGGHLYTEAYLGRLSDEEMGKKIEWLMEEYQTDAIYVHVNPETQDTWLNLDWTAENPGGAFFNASKFMQVYVRNLSRVDVVPLIKPTVTIVAKNEALEYYWILSKGEDYGVNFIVTDDRGVIFSNLTSIKKIPTAVKINASVTPARGSEYTQFTYTANITNSSISEFDIGLEIQDPSSNIWQSRGVQTYKTGFEIMTWRNLSFHSSPEVLGSGKYRFRIDDVVFEEFVGPEIDIIVRNESYNRLPNDNFDYSAEVKSTRPEVEMELMYTDDGVNWIRSGIIRTYLLGNNSISQPPWIILKWDNQPWHKSIRVDERREFDG